MTKPSSEDADEIVFASVATQLPPTWGAETLRLILPRSSSAGESGRQFPAMCHFRGIATRAWDAASDELLQAVIPSCARRASCVWSVLDRALLGNADVLFIACALHRPGALGGKGLHCEIDALVGDTEGCACLFETPLIPNGTEAVADAAAFDISSSAAGSETVADADMIG